MVVEQKNAYLSTRVAGNGLFLRAPRGDGRAVRTRLLEAIHSAILPRIGASQEAACV